MKIMQDHLFSLGAACVLTLGVVLAQDQAPAPASAPAPAPASEMPPPGAANAPAISPGGNPLLSGRGLTSRPRPQPSLSGGASATGTSAAAGTSAAEGGEKTKTTTSALKFDGATVDIILMAYAEVTGKTLLNAPDVPKATITLKSQADIQLTKAEYIEAIEAVLSMNGIVLEPFGEKFVKVLSRKSVRNEGIKILMEKPDGGHPEKTQVISQMIQLKAITISEAQKALEGFKSTFGLIQTFERTNSLLITDAQENINRMLEIVRFIDQPLVASEEVNVRVIRFAKADDIKKRLEELVAESQKQTQSKEEVKANVSGAPGFTRSTTPTTSLSRPSIPGLTRLGAPQPAAATPNESIETLVSDADRGMIRGKVQIISDERSNQLIIITRKENMNFFDKIITVLDIETAPDVKVEVKRLEFADAEEVSTMLNDLIGNVSSKKDEKVPSNASKSTSGASEPPGRSSTLAETLAARAASRTAEAASAGSGEPGKSKLGALSKDNIKILADKRTNALVMMGSVNDLAAIKEIIKGMDIQLSQVLIETVVLEVGLNDATETGIDWVKRVKAADEQAGTPVYSYSTETDADGTVKTVKTLIGYSGDSNYRSGLAGGGGSQVAQNLFEIATNAAGTVVTSGSPGLEYLFSVDSLSVDAVIKASKTDSDAKVLSSPVLLTVDNKEATIEATELKYMYKGMRYMGYSSTTGGAGSYEPDIEQRDVGLTVKVTPRINPNGNVILSVEETFEDVLGSQEISGESWPTITTRKLSADVSVGNGETVILGGLVKTSKSHSASGIPILKDIPFVGKYLFGSTKDSEARSELLVFLTPYVIDNAADMDREARRRKDYINATDIWTKGWSDSKLADPVPASEMKQRMKRKQDIEKAWGDYRKGLGEQHRLDDKIFDERTQTESMINSNAAAVAVRQDAIRIAATNAPAATLKVSESVEVLGPKADEAAEPVAPDVEEPKKRWWKIF